MNKKDALLTIGLLVVIVGGFFLFSREEPSDFGTADNNDTYTQRQPSTPVAPLKPATTGTSASKPKTSVSKPTSSTPAVSETPLRLFENGQYVTVVNLTNTGFVPASVSIAKGESIRFVNKSGNAMRILSSTEYTGLSQERSVGYNGIYELTFPKAGTWTFSSGQTSSFLGVVNVQ